jgi:DNA repair exonuclease SbcCD ATPase subunit
MKARFKRFRVKNALSFVTADMPLDEQGLVLIRGENLDEGGSNGAGKSTLFELLAHLLYGKLTKTDRRIKKSDLLNAHNPKDFMVRLDLASDGEDFQVDQFRAHTKRGTGISITKGGIPVTPDDPREAQKAVSDLVGLTWNEYLGRVYLSQRHTHMMIDGTPAQKREYLSRCFGWDTLDVMVKETTKRLNAIPLPDETHLKSLLEGVEQDLISLGDENELQEGFDTLSRRQTELQQKLVDLKVELSKQESAKAADDDRRRWAKTLSSKFELEMDLEQVKAEVRRRRKSVSSIRDGLTSARKRQSLEEKLRAEGDLPEFSEDVAGKLEALSKKLSRLERDLPGVERRERLSKQLKGLAEESDSQDVLEARTEKWRAKLNDVQSRLSAIKSEVTKLRGVGDVCYTCLRPIEAHEKEEMLREREEDLSRLREMVTKAQEALDHYSQRLSLLQKRTELVSQLEGLPDGSSTELQDVIEGLRKEQTKIQRLSAQMGRVQALKEQLSELPEAAGPVEDMEALLEKQESKLETLEEAYQWLLQYGDLQFDPHALQRAHGAVNSFSTQLEELNQKLLTTQEKLTRHRSLKKQKADLQKTLNASSEEKQRHRVLRYLTVTIEELKKMSLRESTQLLSNVLPLYLNQLFPDGSIKLGVTDDSDGFDLMFNKGGRSIPLTLISGGQAKRVGIAIVFSFAKMGRNTTNLLICDEPFRDLDQNGREACFELLRDFDMGTILVTSHDQDMNAPKKYDQVWTVRMLNHTSRLYLDG